MDVDVARPGKNNERRPARAKRGQVVQAVFPAEEEVQHGQALANWARLADPDFDFEASFKRFTDGYQIPLDVSASHAALLVITLWNPITATSSGGCA